MKRNKKILQITAGVCLIAIAVGLFFGSSQKNKGSDQQVSDAEFERSRAAVEKAVNHGEGDGSYYRVLKKWEEEKLPVPRLSYTIPAAGTTGGKVYSKSQSEGYGDHVVILAPKDELRFDVEVAEQGLYELWMDYRVSDQSFLNPELRISVNGKSQYNEMNELRLPVDWKTEVGSRKVDRYGDELMPKPQIVSGWKSTGLTDPNFFFTEPLKFHLQKGKNSISMQLDEGYILLGKIELKNSDSYVLPYEKYLTAQKNVENGMESTVTIEAENMSLMSRKSIRAKYVRDPQVTPYTYKHKVLNVLDGYSFGDSGDRVTYQFRIEHSGLYQLTLKYAQDTNNGMPTNRRIEIDGKVPFQELEHYQFRYSSGWKNETLHNDKGEPYSIYLQEGEHTLSLSIDNSEVREIYHELLKILEEIDFTARDVNRLTGGLVDKQRDWRIEKYIPEIRTYLQGIAGNIEQQKRALTAYAHDENLSVIAELEHAEDLIRDFVKAPEDLPHYMSKFNKGESSAYGRIKTILPMLLYNPMHLDKMYVHNGGELPPPTAGFATNAVEGVKAFLYSFADSRYSKPRADDDAVEVWVNQSRLYVEVMQRMIDEEFTPATGIKINLSILPDESKIVLSNAAGNTPDAALGISYGTPFELALRGIIENVRSMDGFNELAVQFNPNAFVPYIYDQGVYAIPETQDVKLLFYRKDILRTIGENPPQTWDDVVGLIPLLQKYDMNFYTPLGSDNAYKGFDVTTPFIYQFGGRLYDPTGSKTVINQDGAYHAFEFMTNLFTVYNIPITTSQFFQSFRNGKTPVGIGDANTYIQLKYAAPELGGQWGVLPVPGIKNKAGVIERWEPTYGSSSIIFKHSDKKEQAWKFIKWWVDAETQSAFSYQIQSTLGDKFLYMTANLKGFEKSAWPSDSKAVIMEQWKWIQSTGKVPGDYVLEREISNAWNKVVFDKQNPRIAIDNAVKTINRELERKLKEFGYFENGKMAKPYVVPTIENVESWVSAHGK
ncbi:extracellular solute-binding protein [Paenibacillus sp. KQZ6P-2]|uniref:Extracellular solute-binding protein n=1 Tax=Paenibacillus mangrovi TaxID=2931978 RepID=A0A9X1WK82_9BACL|nr:extracellular solute-binding protein [Paenibacillus mangrovi]